jgi:hypothetical protein
MKSGSMRIFGVIVVVAAVALSSSPGVVQAQGQGGGGPGGQNPPSDAFELYGDLYVIVRDGNGEAIRDLNDCVRPVYAIGPDPAPPEDFPGGLECAVVPLCGDGVDEDACLESEYVLESDDGEVELCDVWDPFPHMVDPVDPDANILFALLQEVHFGRLSVTRSPVDVIDHGYLEAINRLNAVQPFTDANGNPAPNITTDPGGRLHYYANNAETGEIGWFTIDAPLENVGMYDRLMKFGTFLRVEYVRVEKDRMYIVAETAPDWDRYVLSDELLHLHPCWTGSEIDPGCDPYATCDPYADGSSPEACDMALDPTRDDVLTGTSLLAAAGDKTGEPTTDMLIHINTYLHINHLDEDPPAYFPYEDLLGFDPYDRATQFGTKPSVPLLQIDEAAGCNSISPYPCFSVGDLQAYEAASFRDVPHCTAWNTDYFYPADDVYGPSFDDIFGDDDLGNLGYPSDGLGPAQQAAQATEDARAIIWFIHNWAVPELPEE